MRTFNEVIDEDGNKLKSYALDLITHELGIGARGG